MITIYFPQGTIEHRQRISFQDIQELVAYGSGEARGMVECVNVLDADTDENVQLCINEDGMRLRLPPNKLATERFKAKVLTSTGILGVAVVLSGKDLLT